MDLGLATLTAALQQSGDKIILQVINDRLLVRVDFEVQTEVGYLHDALTMTWDEYQERSQASLEAEKAQRIANHVEAVRNVAPTEPVEAE